MPNEEDYLDGLLNSINDKKTGLEETSAREERERQERIARETRVRPDDDFLQESGLSDFHPEPRRHDNLRKAFSEAGFLNDFEKELSDGTADDFIRNFENELDEDDGESEEELSSFLNDGKESGDGFENPVVGEDSRLENFGISGDDASFSENAADEGNTESSAEANQDAEDLNPSDFVSDEPDLSSGPDADDAEEPIIPEAGTKAPDEAVLGNIDEIVRNAKEAVTNGSLTTPSDDENIDLSSILYDSEGAGAPGDDGHAEGEEPDLSAGAGHTAEDDAQAVADLSDLFPDGDTSAKEVPLMDDTGDGSDADLMNLLGDDSELSDLGDLLNADENSEALPEAEQEFESSAEKVTTDPFAGADDDVSLEDLNGGGQKANPLAGIIEKIKGIFAKFGKKDEAAEGEGAPEDGTVNISPENTTPEELAAEDADLLAEFGEEPPKAADAPAEEEDDGKGKKKKKDKKDKKEDDKAKAEAKKAKAEAAAKKKAAKEAAKAKKAAEKAADNSPVIPPKVLVVFVLFAISVVVLYRLFQGAITYRTGVNAAMKQYNDGNYVEAYGALSAMELKEDDADKLDKARLLGLLDTNYRQYAVDMKAKKYEMALSNLIIGTIAYEDNRELAATLGVPDQFDTLGSRIEQQLSDQFGLTVEDARSLYEIHTRRDFSAEIHKILVKLNLITDTKKTGASAGSAADAAGDSSVSDTTAGAETGVSAETDGNAVGDSVSAAAQENAGAAEAESAGTNGSGTETASDGTNGTAPAETVSP